MSYYTLDKNNQDDYISLETERGELGEDDLNELENINNLHGFVTVYMECFACINRL